MTPAEWGVAVEKGDKVYLHIINPEKLNKELTLSNFPYKVKKAYRFETGKALDVKADKASSTLNIKTGELDAEHIDNVIVLQVSK